MMAIIKMNGAIAVHREYERAMNCCNMNNCGYICLRCNECKRWEDGKVPLFYEDVTGIEKEKYEAMFEEMFTGDIKNDKKV